MAERFLICVVLALLASCASEAKRGEADLAQLLDWYPGRYSSGTLELRIVRIYAPLIGDFAFYQQESAADDPGRIVMQRVVAFERVKASIVQTTWSLAEPARWRNAYSDPDVFKGLQSQDFAPMPGCELVWSMKEGRFTGVGSQRTCRSTSSATGGTVYLNLHAELTPEELTLADQSVDVAGRVVQGGGVERFRRL